MKKRTMTMFKVSRIAAGAAGAVTAWWVIKDMLTTVHSLEEFFGTLGVVLTLLILAAITDALYEGGKAKERHKAALVRIACQRAELKRQEHRLRMNINVR